MSDDSDEVVSLSGGSRELPPATNAKSAPQGEKHAELNFGQKPAQIESVTDGMSANDVLQAFLRTPADQVIPWEEVELPSKGYYYGWTSGVVNVRPWGATIDKILATQRLVQSGQAVNKMIEHSCRFPEGFTTEDLLVGDHVFLLYYLRGITHGNVYEFAVTTPSGSTIKADYDLNELSSTITWADRSRGAEPFRVDLPYASRQLNRDVYVGLRYLRVGDNMSIARNKVAMNKAVGGVRARAARRGPGPQQAEPEVSLDDTITQNLSRIIVNVMGVAVDQFDAEAFVARLHSSDTAIIREWLRDNSPGIDPSITLTDPESGQEFTVMLPITESFFRPQDQ